MIDPQVLARVQRVSKAEQIAWAVTVAQRTAEHYGRWHGGLMNILTTVGHFATIEDLRRREAELIELVRTSARHANYALDVLEGLA